MTTTFIETLIRKMHLDDSRIITLTGAGEKTTLLYALAGYLSRTENTLLTTTTHIMEPRDLPNAILVTREDAAALRAAFLSSRLAALGIPVSGPSGAAADRPVLKWRAPSLSFLEEIRDIPARIVCEGDGSRRMPVKIPRQGEPVLYPGTDTVIGVIGLSCLGQPASECLFGWTAAKLENDVRITPDILAQIALSGQGLRKGVTTQHYHVLFNQADCLDMTALRAMQETAQKIRDNGTDCHIVSLKHHIFY